MKQSPRPYRSNKLASLGVDYNSDDSSAGSTTRRINSNKASQVRRTTNERRLRNEKVFNGGQWTKGERLDFLRGLRRFGPGKWKAIQTVLTTRYVICVAPSMVLFYFAKHVLTDPLSLISLDQTFKSKVMAKRSSNE